MTTTSPRRNKHGVRDSTRSLNSSTVEVVPYGSVDHFYQHGEAYQSLHHHDEQASRRRHGHGSLDSSEDKNNRHYVAEEAVLLADDSSNYYNGSSSAEDDDYGEGMTFCKCLKLPSLRRLALSLSLWMNIIITIAKLVAYLQTFSLSVLAALLDSVLDVVSQIILNHTEKHSSMQRSSAFYPAGASRLEPIGVLSCAALMGMASFEVLKESAFALLDKSSHDLKTQSMSSFWSMFAIVLVKLGLLKLCLQAANRRTVVIATTTTSANGGNVQQDMNSLALDDSETLSSPLQQLQLQRHDDKEAESERRRLLLETPATETSSTLAATSTTSTATKTVIADPTLEALAQDHWNDALSNGVAAVALLLALQKPSLWFLDPVGAIIISIYIIYSWYSTGREQIEHLTGKSAPEDFIQELARLADDFDDRMKVDVVRAYHFGPKFLVEIEVVMAKETLLFESHDLGMDLQYEIEGREEVERCFVHIDYQTRPYDEHVVSKLPELREKYLNPDNSKFRSTQSV